jgi:hypothetical protein
LPFIQDAGGVALNITALTEQYATAANPNVIFQYGALSFQNETHMSDLKNILSGVDMVIDEGYYGYVAQCYLLWIQCQCYQLLIYFRNYTKPHPQTHTYTHTTDV